MKSTEMIRGIKYYNKIYYKVHAIVNCTVVDIAVGYCIRNHRWYDLKGNHINKCTVMSMHTLTTDLNELKDMIRKAQNV
jgi:hypothetical protein